VPRWAPWACPAALLLTLAAFVVAVEIT